MNHNFIMGLELRKKSQGANRKQQKERCDFGAQDRSVEEKQHAMLQRKCLKLHQVKVKRSFLSTHNLWIKTYWFIDQTAEHKKHKAVRKSLRAQFLTQEIKEKAATPYPRSFSSLNMKKKKKRLTRIPAPGCSIYPCAWELAQHPNILA